MNKTLRNQLLVGFPIWLLLYFLVVSQITENFWFMVGAGALWALLLAYLWGPEEIDGKYHRAGRMLEAGDPNPWQLWRWMDIFGPTAHANRVHEELYLRRLYIFRCPKFGLMLHWVKREDWDRDALHDHPWEFWRFIVWGGYTETVAYPDNPWSLQPSTNVTHRRFRFSKFPTGAYHRITSVKPHTVSFVINGPKTNSWGFFVPGTGKIGWRDYVDGAR